MELRYYQRESVDAVQHEWAIGHNRTLLVVPTGGGKTIIFSELAKRESEHGRVLILAHRDELIRQAADKLYRSTGLFCGIEKGVESTGNMFDITVGSVQTLTRDNRLQRFDPDHFDVIIVDEAHHCLADSYRKILDYFKTARLLGVTATPDRGDKKTLAEIFDSIAYEYSLSQAIKDGYLVSPKAEMIPLKIDLSKVKTSMGDYTDSSLGDALEPYLEQIADEMRKRVMDRKTVVFLPLIATSQEFCEMLKNRGFRAAEVNGKSADRKEILSDFENGKYNVLCNSMLLTEGWDCPSADCVVILRPTKIRGLYCLDEKTEILTRSGWTSDVNIGDEVLAYDPNSKESRFSPVLAKVRRDITPDEYFCSISGPSVDIRVTNKHRMLYEPLQGKGYRFIEAGELASHKCGARLPVSGHGSFKGVPLTDAEIRFIGWVMTDGCINKYNNTINISQASHQPWVKDIQKCIEDCGFKYGKREVTGDTNFKRNSPQITWYISKGKPRGRDKHLRGWGVLEPYISKDMSEALCDMTERQFDVMLESINQADGHKVTSQSWTQRSYHITKGNKTFIERLQMMAVQRGWRANLTIRENNNGNSVYVLHLKKQDYVSVGSSYERHTPWIREPFAPEKCWCVQTELGTIYTRRNGKVAIMGNCQCVGRVLRLSPETGKKDALILDFLWMTAKHDLVKPASLVAKDDKIAQRIEDALAEGEAFDLIDLEEQAVADEAQAQRDAIAERERSLAQALAAQKAKDRKLVDPIYFGLMLNDDFINDYEPCFQWEMEEPTDKQLRALEKCGIRASAVKSKGLASKLMDIVSKRIDAGLCSPKQMRLLEDKGFKGVEKWSFKEASGMITTISRNNWRVPDYINPATYKPGQDHDLLGWDEVI